MKEQLVLFKTAKLAKEKGFWEDTEFTYFLETGGMWGRSFQGTQEDSASAPTHSLLQKWLREKHKIDVDINRCGIVEASTEGYQFEVFGRNTRANNYVLYQIYEEALEAGLQEALKLIQV